MNYLNKNIHRREDDLIIAIDAAIDDIKSKRLKNVNIKTANPKIAMIVWKYTVFEQITLHRYYDLAYSACESWNNGIACGSFILTRCLYENTALLYDIIKKTEKFIVNNDLDKCSKYIGEKVFANKSFDGLPVAKNIMNSIDEITKIVPEFRRDYERLCEFTHPNLFGMFNLYAKADKQYNADFSNEYGLDEGNFKMFVDFLGSVVRDFLMCLLMLEQLYPKLQKMNDYYVSNLKKG